MRDVRSVFTARVNGNDSGHNTLTEDLLDDVGAPQIQGSAAQRLADENFRRAVDNAARMLDVGHKPDFDIQKYVAVWKPGDKFKLRRAVTGTIQAFGSLCSLNWIDVSDIEDMNDLFHYGYSRCFNGDISEWDVSRVKTMNHMFEDSSFMGDISKWDVRNVREMHEMFAHSQFNGDISDWDVSNVHIMGGMFLNSAFNGDLSKWRPLSCWNFVRMFQSSAFRGNISMWPEPVNANQDLWLTDMFNDSKVKRTFRPGWAERPDS